MFAMPGKRRTKTLKAPFVVTVALTAAAAACGGHAQGEGEGGSSGAGAGSGGAAGASSGGTAGASGSSGSAGTAGSGFGGAGGNPPPPPQCPTVAPEAGSDCAGFDTPCVYDACERGDLVATCTRSGWVLQGPEDCPPVAVECPASPPDWGTPCKPEGAACSYGEPNACCGPAEFHCDGGTWQDWSPTCNPPPPPPCPDVPPRAGTACGERDVCGWWGAQTCSYGDCLSPEGETRAVCESPGQAWTVSVVICD